LLEVNRANHKIVFRKHRRLLPSPDAGSDANKYKQRVGSQGIVRGVFLNLDYHYCFPRSKRIFSQRYIFNSI
jgi:hypothetical protein